MYAETNERMIKAPELSVMIGTSIQTITTWYRWKASNPHHEMAQWLPEYTTLPGGRKTRFWKESEVWKLKEFKKNVTYGRYGIMGKETQKYVIKDNAGKSYIQRTVNLLKRSNVSPEYIEIVKEALNEEFESRKVA